MMQVKRYIKSVLISIITKKKRFTDFFVLIYYKFLNKILGVRTKYFKDDFYYNKKIIIIGPAESSMSYLSGKEIDEFDVIIRINKSVNSLTGKESFLGSRTDVLYHCLDEEPVYGGGKIDIEILKKQKNKFVLYSYEVPRLDVNFYKAILKFRNINICRVNKEFYEMIMQVYKEKIPTTGLQALNHVLCQPFCELHITGFTFFRTAYVDGYVSDSFKSSQDIKDVIKKGGNHDPDADFYYFLSLYNKYSISKVIKLDNALKSIIHIENLKQS